jgi:hypothetical protein
LKDTPKQGASKMNAKKRGTLQQVFNVEKYQSIKITEGE